MPINRLLLSSLVALAAAGASTSDARAAGFVDSQVQQNRMTCPSGFFGPGASSFVSYFADSPLNRPSTGDVMYMRAVVWNLSPCFADTNRFFFTLPETVTLAVTPQTPVICFVGNSLGAVSDVSSTMCTQSPTSTPNGLDFGGASLPPANPTGWFFEVRIPVSYNKWNGGIDWNRQLHVTTSSNFAGYVYPSLVVPIEYRPKFENHRIVTNSNGFDATVAFDLTHYYNLGAAWVIYSTDPAFNYPSGSLPQSTAQAQTNPAWLSHPNSTAQLTACPWGRRWSPGASSNKDATNCLVGASRGGSTST